jgi:uncharacterized protein (TIGR04141 family)
MVGLPGQDAWTAVMDDVIHKLTVYRLGGASVESVSIPSFKLVADAVWEKNNQSFRYRLFFQKSGPKNAGWLPFFRPLELTLAVRDRPQTMTSSFILVIDVAGSVYGVTGGFGHMHLRKNLSIEHRFGINLAQRILSLPELRGLTQRDTSGIVNALDRVFRGLYNPQGDINNLKRVLTHVRGTLQKANPLQATIGRSIQASDALTVHGRKKFDDLITFLLEVNRLLNEAPSRISIPQLEHIDKTANPSLLVELETHLVDTLTHYDADTTHVLFLDNEDFGYLSDRVEHFELRYKRKTLQANTFVEVFECVRDQLYALPSIEARRIAFDRMNLAVTFDDGLTDMDALSRFICGDIEYKNEVYFLNNRKWYRANQEFISMMTRELDNIECVDPSTLGLQEWDIARFPEEKDYNNANGQCVVLDRKTVKVADERGEIEFCDLLIVTEDGVSLIHVKRDTGAALRALFSQGFVSAKLYAESGEFRSKIHAGELRMTGTALRQDHLRSLANLASRQRREMKVIFAIFDDTESHTVPTIARKTSEILSGTLTTFAKADLLERATSIRTMGYQVAVSRLRPYPRPKQRSQRVPQGSPSQRAKGRRARRHE